MITGRVLIASGFALMGLFALTSKGAPDTPADCAIIGEAPSVVTLCDLGLDPYGYQGRFVQVRVVIRGVEELVLDEAGPADPCASYILVLLAFPDDVKPNPDFRVLDDEPLKEFQKALRTYSYLEATIEGRFDSVVTRRDGKLEWTGRGFGAKHLAEGRLVMRRVSDVVVHPLGRR